MSCRPDLSTFFTEPARGRRNGVFSPKYFTEASSSSTGAGMATHHHHCSLQSLFRQSASLLATLFNFMATNLHRKSYANRPPPPANPTTKHTSPEIIHPKKRPHTDDKNTKRLFRLALSFCPSEKSVVN